MIRRLFESVTPRYSSLVVVQLALTSVACTSSSDDAAVESAETSEGESDTSSGAEAEQTATMATEDSSDDGTPTDDASAATDDDSATTDDEGDGSDATDRSETDPANDADASAGNDDPTSNAADGGVEVEFIDLRVEEVGASRAVVRFETAQETTCEVEWGLAADELTTTAVDPDMDPDDPYGLEHNVPLEDLPSETTIYYRAKVVTPDDEAFFSEVRSFDTLAAEDAGPPRSNVALASAGTQVIDKSSNYGGAADDASWGAGAVIDGAMSSEWATAGDGDDAFVTLDLGTERNLVGWGFRSRKMTDGSSIIQSVQLVIDDAATLGPFETPDPDQFYQFDFDEPVAATVVRIDAITTTGGNTGAKEVELYVAD